MKFEYETMRIGLYFLESIKNEMCENELMSLIFIFYFFLRFMTSPIKWRKMVPSMAGFWVELSTRHLYDLDLS